jgi:quercetin dioxygenase-like cupin family protein
MTHDARSRSERPKRLDPEWSHLFSLAHLMQSLRGERPYREQGRNGIVLLKTDELRVVLEVAAEGTEVSEHTVPGPAMVHVLEGELELACLDETRIARAGEIVTIPHDRPRTIAAKTDTSFLWTFAIETRRKN